MFWTLTARPIMEQVIDASAFLHASKWLQVPTKEEIVELLKIDLLVIQMPLCSKIFWDQLLR
jgi:hypothetical protein